MIVGHDGLIVAVGTDSSISTEYDSKSTYLQEIDASTMCILPGLVDGHTHPVWAGDRVHEFKMKLAGATYMDIHAVRKRENED
jgi:imidazolonepropionase